VTALVLLATARARRWLAPEQFVTGALLLSLLALLPCLAFFPGASFLFAWPAIGTPLALFIWRGCRPGAATGLAATALGIVPPILLLLPLTWNLTVALRLQSAAIGCAVLALMLFLTVPFCSHVANRKSIAIASTAGVALLVLGGVWPVRDRLRAEVLAYVADDCRHETLLLRSHSQAPGSEASSPSPTAPWHRYLPEQAGEARVFTASLAPMPLPEIVAVEQGESISVRVTTTGHVAWIDLVFEDGSPQHLVSVGDQATDQRVSEFRYWAPPPHAVLTFNPTRGRPLRLRINVNF
jgi:hypothetical protein